MALLSSDSNAEKITQAYCHYRPGNPQTNCANCHHYTGNGCQIVQDPIRPEMLCDFHAPAARGGLLGR